MKGILLRFKSSLAWALAAAALLVVCILVAPKDKEMQEGQIVLFKLNPDDAREIRVEFPGSDMPEIRAKYREKHEWMMERPVADEADYQVMERIAGYFSTLVSPKGWDADSAEAAEMGPARLKISVMFADGTQHWVEVGNKTASGFRVYAKTSAREGVFEVSKAVWDAAYRPLAEYRDKCLFSVDYFDLAEMMITYSASGTSLAVKKDGDDWEFISPYKAKGDSKILFQLAYDIDRMRITEFLDPARAGELGLEKPAVRVVLKSATEGEADSEALFAFKDSDGKRTWYAKAVGRGAVGVLRDQDLDKIFNFKDRFRFRERRVFASVIGALGEVEVEGDFQGRNISFMVTKDQFKKWRMTKPQLRSVDEYKWGDLVNESLTNLKAEDFVVEEPSPEDLKSFGLQSPPLRITLRTSIEQTGGVKTLKTEFGTQDPKKGIVYARTDGKGPVFTVPLAFLEKFEGGFLRYLNRSMNPHSWENVHKLKFEVPGGELVIEKSGTEQMWQITSPGKGGVVAATDVKQLMQTSFDKVAKYYAIAPYDEAEYGLDKPIITVTLFYTDRDKEREDVIHLSSKGPAGDVIYARYRKGDFRDMGDLVFGLGKSVVERILKLMENK